MLIKTWSCTIYLVIQFVGHVFLNHVIRYVIKQCFIFYRTYSLVVCGRSAVFTFMFCEIQLLVYVLCMLTIFFIWFLMRFLWYRKTNSPYLYYLLNWSVRKHDFSDQRGCIFFFFFFSNHSVTVWIWINVNLKYYIRYTLDKLRHLLWIM